MAWHDYRKTSCRAVALAYQGTSTAEHEAMNNDLDTLRGRAFEAHYVQRVLSLSLLALFAAVTLMALAMAAAHGASRIKDIVSFEGVRDNLLVGYGLVVGLNGTGDTINEGGFTGQSLLSMLVTRP
jgi:hypothetical protein